MLHESEIGSKSHGSSIAMSDRKRYLLETDVMEMVKNNNDGNNNISNGSDDDNGNGNDVFDIQEEVPTHSVDQGYCNDARKEKAKNIMIYSLAKMKMWVWFNILRIKISFKDELDNDYQAIIWSNKDKVYTEKVGWFYNYSFKHFFIRDVVAGITVGILTIPQGLSYGALAGLPPAYGLYSATVAPSIYALLGTSCYVNIGPFAIASFLVRDLLGQVVDPELHPEEYANIVKVSTIMSSCMLLFFGIMQIPLAKFLAKPVMSGLTTGGAVLVAQSQIRYLFGIGNVPRASFFYTFQLLFEEMAKGVNWRDIIISILSFGILLGVDEVNKRKKLSLPGALIAMILVTLLVYAASWDKDEQVQVVGDIPFGIPPSNISMVSFERFGELIVPSFIIAIVGYALTISTGKALLSQDEEKKQKQRAAAQEALQSSYQIVRTTSPTMNESSISLDTEMSPIRPSTTNSAAPATITENENISVMERNTSMSTPPPPPVLPINVPTSLSPNSQKDEVELVWKLDANQEFSAIAIANLLGVLVNGFHSYSSLSRSVLAQKNNAQTPFNNFSSSILVMITILSFGSLIRPIPYSVLATTILVALTGLLKQVKEPFVLWKRTKYIDLVIWLFTFFGCLIFSTASGLLFGVVASISLLLKVLADPKLSIINTCSLNDNEGIPRKIYIETSEKSPVRNELFAKNPNVIVVRFCGSMLFCNAESFQERLLHIVKRGKMEIGKDATNRNGKSELFLVLDLSSMHAFDSIGLEILRNLKSELTKNYPGMGLLFCCSGDQNVSKHIKSSNEDETGVVCHSIDDALVFIDQYRST